MPSRSLSPTAGSASPVAALAIFASKLAPTVAVAWCWLRWWRGADRRKEWSGEALVARTSSNLSLRDLPLSPHSRYWPLSPSR